MILTSNKATKVARQSFQLVPHPFFLNLNLFSGQVDRIALSICIFQQVTDFCETGIPGQIVGDVQGNLSCQNEEILAMNWLDRRQGVGRMMSHVHSIQLHAVRRGRWAWKVRWTTPGWTEKYNIYLPAWIGGAKGQVCAGKRDVISLNKFNPVCNTVDLRIVSC